MTFDREFKRDKVPLSQNLPLPLPMGMGLSVKMLK
jgi:hypothetical protein